MGELDLSPILDKALCTIGRKAQQIDGSIAMQFAERLGDDGHKGIKARTPFGKGKVGMPVATEEGLDLVHAHLAGLSPEARRTIWAQRNDIGFVAIAYGDLYRKIGIVGQIERPEKGLHQNVCRALVHLFDENYLVVVGP